MGGVQSDQEIRGLVRKGPQGPTSQRTAFLTLAIFRSACISTGTVVASRRLWGGSQKGLFLSLAGYLRPISRFSEITGSVASSASDGPCSIGPGARGREVSHRKEQVKIEPLRTAVFCKHYWDDG